MQIENVKISSLKPHPKNPRSHPDEALKRLVKSIKEYGWTNPVLVSEDGYILAGHARVKAAGKAGITEVPIIRLPLKGDKALAYLVADNKLNEMTDWDLPKLSDLLLELDTGDIDIEITGFDNDELESLLVDRDSGNEGLTDDDAVPEVPDDPVTKLGDIWVLGGHRLMCGDSTNADTVERLMNGEKVDLLHADPPYGMGKEKDGVLNDNLYKEKLDAFQMSWWTACRTALVDNGSSYIWGNAEDLWRLWYSGGLKVSERLTYRNEITWDKGHGQGMSAEEFRSYPPASERCLFFMLGEQGFNNNADNYWDGWDSVVNYLRAEKDKTGWDIAKFKRLAGHSETSGCHWFDKSQWNFPTKEVYQLWQAAAREHDAFKKEHDELKKEHDELKKEHDELKKEFYETRAFFDNTHENMTDVWQYERVQGDERHGHPTPKPVKMMERCIKSSCPDGGVTLEPFGGSGSTLIACEKTNRRCRMMELDPHYCDVIINRWQDFTGQKATHAESLIDFNDIKEVSEAAA